MAANEEFSFIDHCAPTRQSIDFERNCLMLKIRDSSLNDHRSTHQLSLSLQFYRMMNGLFFFHRLEFIVSNFRGRSMTRVATGLQTGEKLTEVYGGGRKKKIFVFLPSGFSVTSTLTSLTSTNPSTSPSASASTSTVTSTFTSTITSTSILPSTSTTVFITSTPTITSSSTVVSTSPVTSTIMSTSTVTSMSTVTSTSTSSSTSHAPTSSSTGTSSQRQVAMVDLTKPPTNGASTRRFLAELANNATSLTVDDDTSDSDLDWDSNVSGQMTIRPASLSLRPAVTALTGTGHQRAQREPRIYGYVTDDFSTLGAATDEDVVSRTKETLKCLDALEVDGQNATLPFLTHTFEEFIWQGTEDVAVMVAILFHLHMPQDQLRKLITMLNNTTTTCKDCYLWIADFDSIESEKVKLKYGLKGRDCTLLVLAPSHSRNMPQCVETFDDSNLEEDSLFKAMGMARDFCSAIKDERRKLEAWRLERQQQEEALKCAEENEPGQEEDSHSDDDVDEKQTMPNIHDNKSEEQDEEPDKRTEEDQERSEEEENDIRKARRVRCGDTEVTAGHTIRVRTKHGIISRMFAFGAHYQEVYDWVGSQEEMPLHFTLHRGDVILNHQDKLCSDEALNITEREESEATRLLDSQVSFKGNVPQSNEKLSSTLVDAPQKNKREEKEHQKEVRKRHVNDSQTKGSGQKVKGNENQEECGQQETGSNDGDQKADKSNNKRKKKKEKRSGSQRKKAKKEGQGISQQSDDLANTASN